MLIQDSLLGGLRGAVVLLLLLYAFAAAPLAAAPAEATKPAWIGRWYIDDAAVCKERRGEAEGLLVYTEREFFGIENRCWILSAAPKGSGTELKMRCRGEGTTSHDSQVVEVVAGKLRRTVPVDRRKTETFTYSRCP